MNTTFNPNKKQKNAAPNVQSSLGLDLGCWGITTMSIRSNTTATPSIHMLLPRRWSACHYHVVLCLLATTPSSLFTIRPSSTFPCPPPLPLPPSWCPLSLYPRHPSCHTCEEENSERKIERKGNSYHLLTLGSATTYLGATCGEEKIWHRLSLDSPQPQP